MGYLSRISVGRKLQWVLGVALVSLGLVGAFGAAQIARIASSTAQIGGSWLPAAVQAQRMAQLAAAVRNREFAYILVSYDERAQVLPKLQRNIEQMSEQLQRFGTLPLDPRERRTYERVVNEWHTYQSFTAQIEDAIDRAAHASARQIIMQDSAKSFERLTGELDELSQASERAADRAGAEAGGLAHRSLAWIVAAVIVAAAVAAALMTLVVRAITVPLKRAVDIAQTVARGDLTLRIDTRGEDETARLIRSLAEMSERLRKLIAEVSDGVQSVNIASGEIASGNQDLSSRTENVAFSVQQTAEYMSQVNAVVAQSVDTAQQASVLSRQASDAAERGGEMVSRVVGSMEAITDSSRKIGEITTVIDGIAFQTNILALNAAVEAARAGEQGRGFAVVAGEVRMLAQRAAAAAKEIRELVGSSSANVEAGGRLVNEAGASMIDIVDAVRRVNALIETIADSAQAQQRDLNHVREAVEHIDETTQQNAALVEQSASAAVALREQADRLAEQVSVFRLHA
ncbi:methyl-accepting chemotaxis protein [Trinickia dabaoshanensis]|nr:methyl-accepting chemotaxis protein [Trinickia dabaoshanensis]